MARATREGLSDVVGEYLGDLAESLEVEAKLASPVDTGALRRSIRTTVSKKGRFVDVEGLDYGGIQNATGPHKGWLDNAVQRAAGRT